MRDLGAPGQGGEAQAGGLPTHRLQDVDRHVYESAIRGVGNRVQQDQVAQALEQVRGEAARIVARLHDPLHGPEQGRTVGRREGVDRRVDECGVRDAEQAERALVGDALRPGAREQLVHDRQRVTR